MGIFRATMLLSPLSVMVVVEQLHAGPIDMGLEIANDQFASKRVPFYTTADNPDNYLVATGGDWNGVGQIDIRSSTTARLCTGSLLSTGRHVLSAAHCFTDQTGALNARSATVSLAGDDGQYHRSIMDYAIPPAWSDDLTAGYDIAVLELVAPAPSEISRYEMYNKNDEVGRVGTKVGYGRSGHGRDGATLPPGRKRMGTNRYDRFAQSSGLAGMLLYDFDNGHPGNDAFGVMDPALADTGLGADEVLAAPGDSGGPTFIDGMIAGVHAGGFRFAPTDVDDVLNSSFGEIGIDTRISPIRSFIQEAMAMPAPSSLWLLLLALIALATQQLRMSGLGRRRLGEDHRDADASGHP